MIKGVDLENAKTQGYSQIQAAKEEIAKGMQQIIEATEKDEVADTMDNIKKIVEDKTTIEALEKAKPDTKEFLLYKMILKIKNSVNPVQCL